MKIVIVNGSARKGNTLAAIDAFSEGAKESNEIEVLQADKLKIDFCKGCGVCECYKGCVDKDDTNSTIDKLVEADMIVFATPVYWWGMTAQLKLIIDKCYCRGAQLKGKKIGVLVPGGSPVEATQYELIKKQFECMAQYLSWDILFYKSFYATGKDEIRNDDALVKELAELGRSIS
ncbi:MAG: flavodoxin family protein [Eubacteriales bacterium]|nr:flavodoxin family protein [Eubacteriales bacterium]